MQCDYKNSMDKLSQVITLIELTVSAAVQGHLDHITNLTNVATYQKKDKSALQRPRESNSVCNP